MTAAISFGLAANAARTASRLLKGTVTVRRASAFGTPALSGVPWVNAPLPDLTSRESPWPW
jgi:hypothetical protein